MKIKYLFTGVLISMLAFMSCEDPDDLARTGSENVTGPVENEKGNTPHRA